MKFADDLRTARVRKKLSQQQLAYVAGITNVTISNIETGMTQPAPETREKIEKVLGPIDWSKTFDEAKVQRQIISN